MGSKLSAPPRKHYPALDGLRGLAALMVFLDHYGGIVLGYSWMRTGWAGVDFFFVLSGFLITGGLVDSLGEEGALKRFYMKRALRIFPLYIGFWVLIAVLQWPVHLVDLGGRYLLWPLYVGNLLLPSSVDKLWAISQVPLHIGARLIPLDVNHFWSLCVEEQFYLVWPWLLLAIGGRRWRLGLCVAGVALPLAFRCWMWGHAPYAVAHSEWAYHQTYTRIDGLMLGSAVAVLVRTEWASTSALRRIRNVLLAGPGLLIMWHTVSAFRFASQQHLPLVADLGSKWSVTVGFSLVPLFATGVLMCCLRQDNILADVLSLSPLRKLGKISYGFYVFHNLPLLIMVGAAPALRAGHLALAAVITWFYLCCCVAWLSFRYFETPFLRWKDRIRTQEALPLHVPSMAKGTLA